MANALQEQLLKAGLADKNKANRINKEKHKKNRQKRNAKEEIVDENKIMAEKAIAEKAERDRELNRLKEQKAEEKAVQAQIRQLIVMNRVVKGNADDIAYNFEHKKKIKRIYVNQDIHNHISKGMLAIVVLQGQYELVPKVVAEKISTRDKDVVILLNEKTETEEVDDFYADYEIPDDLMW
jgi:uncharacterized protein YaiL (DUF2058 family)